MLSVPSTLCRRSSDSVVSCVVQNSIFTAALCFIIISLEKLWDWGSKIWSTINAGLSWQGWYVELSDAPVSRNSFGSCELTHAIFWCLVPWILRPSLWPPSSIFTFSLFLLFPYQDLDDLVSLHMSFSFRKVRSTEGRRFDFQFGTETCS